jgi:hypothetical protein
MKTLSLIFLSFFSVCSGSESPEKTAENNHFDQSVELDNQINNAKISDIKDTTLNNLIFLRNPSSLVNVLGDVSKRLNRWAHTFPDIYFINQKKDEYVRLVFYPGFGPNDISVFEVGYTDALDEPVRDFKLNPFGNSCAIFFTESGIKLGISKEVFLNISKKDIELKEESDDTGKYMVYRIDDELYEAKYYFNNENVLIKFCYGYIYP